VLAGDRSRAASNGAAASGAQSDGVIELQGDHRPVVMEELRAGGYDAVLAGG
jgi:translation initiation factor 1 (eIF-1/SUI1)